MSFKEKNKYFLQNSFDRSFHELLEFAQMEHYRFSIRANLLIRLKDYYKSISPSNFIAKVDFYEEIINLLWRFEKEYILANILFEEDFNNIFTQLDKNRKVFDQIIFVSENDWSLELFINAYRNKYVHFFSTNLNDFLKEYLSDITERLNPDHWINSSKNANSISLEITHTYPKFLINELCHQIKLERLLFTHILFTKTWILNFNHHEVNDAKISIIFMHQLITEYKIKVNEDAIPRLHDFLAELEGRFSSFFFEEFKKTPLLEKPGQTHYPPGYHNQKIKLREVIEQSEFLHNPYLKSRSYLDLFNSLSNAHSKAAIAKLEEVIFYKTQSFEYPSKKDLEGIVILQTSPNHSFYKIRDEFYRRFYLFEYLI